MKQKINKIFTPEHLIFNVECKNIKDAFHIIAKKAKSLGIVNDANELVNGFTKREKIASTNMQQSFAIPHTMSAHINFPAIIVVKFKSPIIWNKNDENLVKVAIALLIPEKQRSELQVEYLARISTGLMDNNFTNIVLTSSKIEVIKAINNVLRIDDKVISISKTNDKQDTLDNSKQLIVGISACATGIAHTYMAREALEKHGKEMGYDVWIETQGQSGQEHKLSSELINKASYVVIASDIGLDLERFKGKKIYITKTNEAINTPKQTLNKAINSANIYGANTNNENNVFESSHSKGFMKHFLAGVSYMIPFIVFSGIVYAILNAICVGLHDTGKNPDGSLTIMGYALQVANVGFALFTGVMGAFIAQSIGGRAALGPGFIASFVASSPSMYLFYGMTKEAWLPGIPDHADASGALVHTTVSDISLGIIAAIMMGFAAGHLVNLFNNKIKIHKTLKPIMPLIVIPVCCTSLLVFPFLFALSGIMGIAMNYFGACLAFCGTQWYLRILIGFILGAMVGFDMGGPINKIAVAAATTLIPVDPSLMGAVAAAIPIAPLGCGFASVIFGRQLFDDNEKGLGVSSLALGFMGISEGAIPFAAKRLKQTFIANIIGSSIAGGLACMFFVGGHVGMWGGLIIAFTLGIYSGGGSINNVIPMPFGVNGGGSNIENALLTMAWYFLAILIGAIIHAFVYIILIRSSRGEKGVIKNLFTRHKNKEASKENNVNQFSWYKPYVVSNWYYQKVCNITITNN